MQSNLQPLAITCKITASVQAMAAAWLLIGDDIYMLRATSPPRDVMDWGTPAFYHRLYVHIAVESLLVILVLIPNRWLVFSRITFMLSLAISLLPLGVILLLTCSDFDTPFNQARFLATLGFAAYMIILSAPWPLSVILSRTRFRRGAIFTYA